MFADIVVGEWEENITVAAHQLFPDWGETSQVVFGHGFIILK